MGRHRSGFTQLSIWLPDDLLKRAAELAPRLQAQREANDPDARITGRAAVSADVIRVALKRGIKVLDGELPAAPGRKSKTGKSKRKR